MSLILGRPFKTVGLLVTLYTHLFYININQGIQGINIAVRQILDIFKSLKKIVLTRQYNWWYYQHQNNPDDLSIH